MKHSDEIVLIEESLTECIKPVTTAPAFNKRRAYRKSIPSLKGVRECLKTSPYFSTKFKFIVMAL